jgi:hypothetical protein
MSEKFEAWGIVELMGHQQAAGRLSEQSIGGGNLLRVDIPLDGETFRTVFYGNSSIYALHVTDEATARAAAKTMGRKPPYAYAIESASPRLSAAGAFDDDDEPEGSHYGTDL